MNLIIILFARFDRSKWKNENYYDWCMHQTYILHMEQLFARHDTGRLPVFAVTGNWVWMATDIVWLGVIGSRRRRLGASNRHLDTKLFSTREMCIQWSWFYRPSHTILAHCILAQRLTGLDSVLAFVFYLRTFCFHPNGNVTVTNITY